MTKEELLVPRYRVIGKYPDSPYRIGQVLTLDKEITFLRVTGGEWAANWETEPGIRRPNSDDSLVLSDMEECSAIFKKLQWWEERKLEDMPEYVKDTHGEVVKVERWDINTTAPKVILAPSGFTTYAHWLLGEELPATKEEYDAYMAATTTNTPNLRSLH